MNEVSDAMERHAEAEVKRALKGLLRNLEDVRRQRGAVRYTPDRARDDIARQRGEVEGLNIAIYAIKRRIR